MQLVHVHSTNTYLSDYENKSKLFLMVIIYTCRVPPSPQVKPAGAVAPLRILYLALLPSPSLAYSHLFRYNLGAMFTREP